jgi:hypothetical protein
MSEVLATSPRLISQGYRPDDEADTVEGRLADIIETADVLIDEYRLSTNDRAKVVSALRSAACHAPKS